MYSTKYEPSGNVTNLPMQYAPPTLQARVPKFTIQTGNYKLIGEHASSALQQHSHVIDIHQRVQ